MAHEDASEALLRERLPPELVAQLAREPPEVVDASFIDDGLRESAADRLFRLRLRRKRPLFVDCLVEHKSAPDPRVALQVLRYMVRIWEGEERESGGKAKLPSIVPLLVYHGAEPWNASPHFLALVEPGYSSVPKPLDFEMVVVDLGEIDDASLSSNPTLRAGLLALKYSTREAMQRARLGGILKAMKQAPKLVPVGLAYIMATYRRIDRAFLLGEVRRVMPEYEEAMLSIAAREWKAEGRAEARVEILLQILEHRFGPLAENARARIAGATTAEVDAWLGRAMDAPTLDAAYGDPH
jgi:hypothetical protein